MHQTHGFHTVRDSGDADWIEANAPFQCTHRHAWLSAGYYFWEKDEERAHQWGQFAYVKQGKDYVILRAKLALSNMLDLVGDPDHMRQMRDFMRMMRQENPAWRKLTRDPPLGEVIELLRRYHQKAHPGIFPYTAVRAQDTPRPYNATFVAGRRETTDLNPRIQICVFRKSDATLHPLRIIFPEHYV